MDYKIWVKEKHIEMWVHNLPGPGNVPYNDCEKVRHHPLLLRVRLWLALSRIRRRNRKLLKFVANNLG